MAFQYSTPKQQDKEMKKSAVTAQRWMQKGFSPEQVAETIWNRVGYVTDVKDGMVRFHGTYNGEKGQRVRCEITTTTINGPF